VQHCLVGSEMCIRDRISARREKLGVNSFQTVESEIG
jgi:hypothetical protein